MKRKEEDRPRRGFLNKSANAIAAVVAAGWLSTLQQCHDPETGKKEELLSPDGEIVEVDTAYIRKVVPDVPLSQHKVRDSIPGRKWVMAFDLSRCKGAGKCLSACSKMHYLPPQRSYITLTKMKDAKLSSPYWMPSLCFHCDSPPCVKVCPVDATFKLSDGIVNIDTERCIGCRFCMVACPYAQRVFNWGEESYELTPGQLAQMTQKEICAPHRPGTVEKCDFCPHNLVKEMLPDCVTGCPYGAIYFGDENEDSVSNGREDARLSEMLKANAGYRYLEELGTRPRVYYLPPVDRMFPFEDRELPLTEYL